MTCVGGGGEKIEVVGILDDTDKKEHAGKRPRKPRYLQYDDLGHRLRARSKQQTCKAMVGAVIGCKGEREKRNKEVNKGGIRSHLSVTPRQ
jgi:hypothetical protein